jgi:excisionase family DNA binding protein
MPKDRIISSPAVMPGAAASVQPIAVTVSTACRLGGFGPTTCWRLIADGTLQTVRVGRRRLILYNSLVRLLTPDLQPQARRHGRPRPAMATEAQ